MSAIREPIYKIKNGKCFELSSDTKDLNRSKLKPKSPEYSSDLQSKSIIELEEMLHRQEALMKKPIMNKLSDGGKKIKECYYEVQKSLEAAKSRANTKKLNYIEDIEWLGKIQETEPNTVSEENCRIINEEDPLVLMARHSCDFLPSHQSRDIREDEPTVKDCLQRLERLDLEHGPVSDSELAGLKRATGELSSRTFGDSEVPGGRSPSLTLAGFYPERNAISNATSVELNENSKKSFKPFRLLNQTSTINPDSRANVDGSISISTSEAFEFRKRHLQATQPKLNSTHRENCAPATRRGYRDRNQDQHFLDRTSDSDPEESASAAR